MTRKTKTIEQSCCDVYLMEKMTSTKYSYHITFDFFSNDLKKKKDSPVKEKK